MKKDRRILITLPDGLRRVVKQSAQHRGCSQAEVIRGSLYGHLKDFIDKDNNVKIVKPKKEEDEFKEIELEVEEDKKAEEQEFTIEDFKDIEIED
jgi:hypothetical protein